MKRWLACLLVCGFTLGAFGCSFNGENAASSKPKITSDSSKPLSEKESASEEESSSAEKSNENWAQLLGAQPQKTLSTNGVLTYTVDKTLGEKNYVKIDLETDVHLYGEFTYADTATGKTATEVFYIEKGATTFKQFLDAFRPNGIGCFEKTLQSIKLTNKSEGFGNVQVKGVYVSDRTVPEFEREVYIEKDGVKVGADLAAGGALTYLGREYYETGSGERQKVEEVIDYDNNVYIGVGMDESDYMVSLSSSVNLINIYDLGRQFQQSYYAEIGGEEDDPNGANGYTRGYCDTTGKGYYWPYNPVQVGDCAENPSQIIDYEITSSSIWIKIRPMDWSKGDTGRHFPNTFIGGETTKSYMENRYTINNGVVFVENSFVDWNGFYDLEETSICTNELPAAYIVHPLRNYVCYTGDKPWTDDKLDISTGLGYWDGFRIDYKHLEDWFAWVNNEHFGVGVYVPNMKHFTSGSYQKSSSINLEINRGAFSSPYANKLLYNKVYPTSMYTSCYVSNMHYTSPANYWRLKEYERRCYEYAISVDYVDEMRNQFKEIHSSGKMTNASLDTWIE